ncbi:DinB family protein [Vibrio sp. 99-8-1]|uniref:DinB family protein n=1 Tax=Vibrio sp. 99-8-1 TaxID=2607602 RepID=UPI001493ADE2|nr:DinB family protein [Vibrio sp. 99-8-1]NOI65029.1 damage-inducible protein DinB [Vibrio sp. 99-8-1]
MKNCSFIVELVDYKIWSDQNLLQVLQGATDTPEMECLDFCKQQLHHMIIVEELFRARLTNSHCPHVDTNSKFVPDLSLLSERLNESDRWLKKYCSKIEAESLIKEVKFKFVDGKRGKLSVLEILFHIVNHGTYHRSAIGHALQHSGGQRPPDTYTMFIHQKYEERRI